MSGPFPYSPDRAHPDLERIARALAEPPPMRISHQGMRRAAVLLPLFSLQGELNVLFTLRAAGLKRHAGQISFPGGGLEPEDADLLAAALREAREELALESSAVRILGKLDDVLTIVTGYHVTPFVGMIVEPFSPVPREEEVAEVFHVPLAAFRAPGAARIRVLESGGSRLSHTVYDIGGREVWGATARIMKTFLDRVLGEP